MKVAGAAMAAFCLMIAAWSPASAWACACRAVTAESSKALVAAADLIFTGAVMALSQTEMPSEDFDYRTTLPAAQNPYYARARLKVLDLYKGMPPAGRVEAYIDTLGSCAHQLQAGDQAAFILRRIDGVLVMADICGELTQSDWKDLEEGVYRK